MKTLKLNSGLAFIAFNVLMFASVTSLHAGAGFTTLVAFTYTNAPNYGWNFQTSNQRTCALLQGDDGDFYGTTFAGGNLDRDGGTVFKMTPNGAFTSLYSFGTLGSGNLYSDGNHPIGNLTKGADGRLYGTTWYSGRIEGISNGTVFGITTNGVLNTLYTFGSQGYYFETGFYVWPDGRFPNAGLVLGSDGNFYGTTTDSGSNHWGTVFRLTSNGVLTTLHSFIPDTDGCHPNSELVEGNDGNFYGTTAEGGGVDQPGTVFRISPTGTFTTLISFNGTNGSQPIGGLLLGKDGNFYGAAQLGGNGNRGTVFRLTTNGILTTLCHFTDPNDGAYPSAALIQASDGNFYGTTSGGGAHVSDGAGGTVFQLTPNGKLTTLYSFSGSDGHQPEGALVQGKDGELYGTTSYGGPQWIAGQSLGYGTIFRITIPPTFLSITPTNGAVALTWSVTPGHTYQLQSTANFSSPNWINLGSVVTATNSTATAFDSVTNAQCFYRIELLP